MLRPDDITPIAENAYAIFNQKHPGEPGWDALPANSRRRWTDVVLDFSRQPNLLAMDSPNLQEACVTAAVKAYPTHPTHDPDAEVAKLREGKDAKH